MSFRNWWSKSKRNIYLGTLFALSIVLVTYLMPREGKFRYEYQKGRPWMHDVLIAPMDFPVHKTETELGRERDSALVSFSPFFDYDTSLVKYQLSNFNSYFNEMRLGSIGTVNELSTSEYEMLRYE
ncbi:MAG: hypothetical protein ACQETA_06105, partial [Bacteroidota bacterium]